MFTNRDAIIERLMDCGYRKDSAEDICKRYERVDDYDGLDALVKSCEQYSTWGMET